MVLVSAGLVFGTAKIRNGFMRLPHSSTKYSSETPKYFESFNNLSNFGLLRPDFQSDNEDGAIPVAWLS